jgi:nitroreductase
MNPVLKAIRERRSIREFTDEALDEKEIEAILEAGRWAPSGLNNQPWRFVLISDEAVRKEISKMTEYSEILNHAPLLIAVFLDIQQSYNRGKDLQAVGACLQNMYLAAHSLGLGSVWVGEILNRREDVERALGVPEQFELMAVQAVGHPRKDPSDSERKPLSELIYKRV